MSEQPKDTAAAKRHAVFLDRDGVLSRVRPVGGIPRPPESVAELELEPGASEACRRLHEAGLLLIVVSNQPDIARGTQTMAAVEALNRELRARLPLDDVRICPHDDADRCVCRKPKAGMLIGAAADWGIELRRSFMVGDRWRDIEAGRRARCATVFVDRGYAERRPQGQDLTVRSLDEAVPWLLAQWAEA